MKKITLVLLVTMALFLAGCLPKKSTVTTQTGQTETQTEKKGGLFESIKDAMSKSLSLQCEYSVGDIKSSVYIKGKMLRSETASPQGKAYAILKDNQLWTWTDKDNNGLIIDLSDTPGQGSSGQKSSEEIIEEVEKYKESCKQTVVSDSIFNPPENINFQDLGQMFKNFGQ